MLGVNVAIFKDGKILLTKREDFEVWCLPGGHIDGHESFGEAAIREAYEEVGYQVKLLHLIGLYARPKWRMGQYYLACFAGEIIGGDLNPDPNEVVEARFFGMDELDGLDWAIGHHQRVLDAFSGVQGIVRHEGAEWPFEHEMTREALYAKRDASGMGRSEFFLMYFKEADDMGVEVVGLLPSPPAPLPRVEGSQKWVG